MVGTLLCKALLALGFDCFTYCNPDAIAALANMPFTINHLRLVST
jgi:hypothetical protein